ncbi:UPF0187 protein [Vanrija pseudolonga]|uniref:UPF0187 protein n=1 Tax=Vanrija pseudolonga TaxID=143232 RepID=A0AAF0YGG6_9TREE|nr:UPF0187 protein [Vanrija pseudolonga]
MTVDEVDANTSPEKNEFHAKPKSWLDRLLGTAFFRVWPTLLFMGGWSAMVCLVNVKTSVNLTVPHTMITVLGVLLGLTLSYRTSSAYEKYSDGMKQWGNITLGSRNWARTIWLHCPDHTEKAPVNLLQDKTDAIIEKKTVVQLALAFAVAMKHYLRREKGTNYDDLHHLVAFIPTLNTSHSTSMGSTSMPSGLSPRPDAPKRSWTGNGTGHEMLPAENPYPHEPWYQLHSPFHLTSEPESIGAVESQTPAPTQTPPLAIPGDQDHGEGQNVPLEITHFMAMYIAELQERGTIDSPTTTALMNAVVMLSDAQANLERILNAPIPWSFSAHIHSVNWIYCLVLPFQLYASAFGWVTIPATVITAFIIMGYASIAEEIEDPFGYDRNDFDTNHFCKDIIAKELAAVTSRPPLNIREWIFNHHNRSLGKDTNAKTLAEIGDPSVVHQYLKLGSPTKSNFPPNSHPPSSTSLQLPRNNKNKRHATQS